MLQRREMFETFTEEYYSSIWNFLTAANKISNQFWFIELPFEVKLNALQRIEMLETFTEEYYSCIGNLFATGKKSISNLLLLTKLLEEIDTNFLQRSKMSQGVP